MRASFALHRCDKRTRETVSIYNEQHENRGSSEFARKLNAEEYSRLPAVFKDELLEGERVWAPMPKFSHMVVLDNLEALLRKQFPQFRLAREAGWRFQLEDDQRASPVPT